MKSKFFLSIFFILIFNINLFGNDSKNVLIINSYHRGFQWSDDVIGGIEDSLYETKVDTTILYMDSKRISSYTYNQKLKDLYKLQLLNRKYDLVVAVDKYAYEFLLENYDELFTNELIYFVGIEQYSQDSVNKHNLTKKVAGLVEKRAINDTAKLIHKLMPKIKKLYIINDKSGNGDDSEPFILSTINNLNDKMEIEYIRNSSINELKNKFNQYSPHEAIFFVRFYNDKDGNLYKNSEISEMISSFSIPVFSTDTLFVGKGSIGGKLVPINDLGKEAGKDIQAILNNRVSVPFVKIYENYRYIFDYTKVKKFNIKPETLKTEIEYINIPVSFFDKYRQFVDFVFLLSPFLLFLILGLIHNIYLRIKNTKLLKQRMQFDKVLLDSIKSPIVWEDDKGKVVDSNSKFCDFMDLPCPKIRGKKLKDYIHNGKNPLVGNSFNHIVSNFLNEENQITIKDDNGKEFIYLVNQTNYTDNVFKTKGTVTILTDITKERHAIAEKRKHQEFIIQQSKLAEIGEVFSSIAHQWKTPLVEIATIVQEKLYSDDIGIEETNNCINDIMFQVKYMTETINSFQKFIMPSTQKIVFDINESIEEMLEIIRHNMKYNYIDVKVIVEGNTNLMTLGYKNEFMQILLNIVNNAKESILKKKSEQKISRGEITINIKNVYNKIQIEIQDNGEGIPEKYIEQIFKPYFTTKKDGHGIGLYMAKLIIEDKIGGSISVLNTNIGAKFIIQLETTI